MKTVKSLSLAWIFIALLSSAEASYNVQQYWITPNNTEIYFTHVINGVPDSQVGHYGCWTGTMWGIPVVMVGGDEQFQAYSIMTPVGTNLQYIGEFGGNANSWGTSGYFQQALLFLPQTMNIGDQVQTTNNRYGLDPSIRAQVTSVLNRTATITLSAHYDQYQIPELAYLGSNDPVDLPP